MPLKKRSYFSHSIYQFSIYYQYIIKSLRDKIVDFKGKKLIKIERELKEKNKRFLDSIDDKDGIIEEYCEKIKQNTKNNIVDINSKFFNFNKINNYCSKNINYGSNEKLF